MSRTADETDEQERKLFVGGLNKEDTDEAKIKGYFSSFGEIVDVTIMRDQNKISRGFGFVLFESNKSVDDIMRAKKEGSSFTLDNHNVEVKRALPKIGGTGGESGSRNSNNGGGMHRKIFVGGLASTADESSVSEYFEKFGDVTEVELLRCRETHRLRGFAFVTFADEDSADKCIQKRNHIINKKSCEVKRAQTRSNLTRDEDHHHHAPPRSREPRDAGPPAGQQMLQPGMMDINMVNQLITEAHLQGFKQGMSQANPASALLGGNLGAPQTPSAASLLQALQNPQVSVPAAPPQQPAQNGDIATQLVGLLRQAQSNPDIMALIGNAGKEGARPAEQRPPPTSSSASYSTSYPAPSTYDYYTQQSAQSNYGPVKEDDHKQRSYRPY